MATKPERNDPCHCGSGKKYKNCCLNKDSSQLTSKMGVIGLGVALVIGLILVIIALSSGGSPVDCPPGTAWSEAHQHCH